MVLLMLILTMVLLATKMQNSIIRKITIGKDYKNDSMHYAVGQDVYGWKDFNKNMAVSVEYNLEY